MNPVEYFRCEKGHTVIAEKKPAQCPKCGSTTIVQLTETRIKD